MSQQIDDQSSQAEDRAVPTHLRGRPGPPTSHP